MTYIKHFLILFILGQYCGSVNSTERYVFDFLSKDWTDDRCKQWPKIKTKKIPSDLDLMQLRETLMHHEPFFYNNNIRRYLTKGLTIGVKNNNNSTKLDIRIVNSLTDLRSIVYNPKKRILLHEFGSVLHTYKINYRSNYVSFDDKDPYPTTYHFDQSGRLIKSIESYSAR